MLEIQADTRICDADLDAWHVAFHYDWPRAQNHPASVRCVFDGVDDQLIQRFLYLGRVAIDVRRVFILINDDFNISFCSGFGKIMAYIIY